MAKMKEGSLAYNTEALELALGHLNIYPCIDCGHPIKEDCCCGHCGSGNGHEQGDPSYLNYKPLKSY